MDTATPKILAADAALQTLPADGRRRVQARGLDAGVLLGRDRGPADDDQGPGRFGLPELQVRNVPPQLGRAWTHVLTGLASSLLGIWLTALRDRAEPAFAQLPAALEVREADIARAYDAPDTEGPAVRPVRLYGCSSPANADLRGRDSFAVRPGRRDARLHVRPPIGATTRTCGWSSCARRSSASAEQVEFGEIRVFLAPTFE